MQQDQLEQRVRDYLDGRTDIASLERQLRGLMECDQDAGWAALSLIDRYYRTGRLSAGDFQQLRQRLSRSLAGLELGEFTDALRETPSDDAEEESPPASEAELDSAPLDDIDEVDEVAEVDEVETAQAQASAETGPASRMLRDRFVLERQLGRGGMGTVYMALDRRRISVPLEDRYVAVKLLHREIEGDPHSLQTLQAEFHRAQSLSHPNIVNVFDLDEDDGSHFLTMELLRGESLRGLIDRHAPQPLPRDLTEHVLRGIGAALEYAHARGVVHADLKPGNVFVNRTNDIKVLDFGLACAAPRPGEPWIAFDDSNSRPAAATPTYASPDVLQGQQPEPSDDLYALACIAYELYSGRHPFDRRTALEARTAGLRPQRPAGLSRRAWQALQAGLAWQRSERPNDVGELLGGLGLHEGPQSAGKGASWLMHVAWAIVTVTAVAVALRWSETPRGRTVVTPPQSIAASPSVPRQTDAGAAGQAETAPAEAEPDGAVTEAPTAADAANEPPPQTAEQPAQDNAPAAVAVEPVSFTFGDVSYAVSESAGIAEVVVRRGGDAGGAVTIEWWTRDGSATAGRDYGALERRVETFAPGETERTLLIPIVADTLAENDQFFYVELADSTAPETAIARATVIIVDDD